MHNSAQAAFCVLALLIVTGLKEPPSDFSICLILSTFKRLYQALPANHVCLLMLPSWTATSAATIVIIVLVFLVTSLQCVLGSTFNKIECNCVHSNLLISHSQPPGIDCEPARPKAQRCTQNGLYGTLYRFTKHLLTAGVVFTVDFTQKC